MTTDDRFEHTVQDLFAGVGRPDARTVVADTVATTRSMRQRPAWVQLDWWLPEPGSRRGAPIGRLLVVAALIVLAIVGALAAGSLLRTTTDPRPGPAVVITPRPTLEPTPPVGARVWDAIFVRPDTSDASALDVVLVRGDGAERLLRRVGLELPGSEFTLSGFGSVSRNGWLALSTTSSGQLPVAAYGLFDLAHPEHAPLTVPYPPVIPGRWSVNDLFALSSASVHSPTGWMSIDVVDPRTGATTGLGKVDLFGGEPDIVWVDDGSGILDGQQLRPVNGVPDIPIGPTVRFLDRRVGMGGSIVGVCRASDPADVCPNASTIRVTDAAGHTVDWYTVLRPNEEPADAIFAADGRSLLVTFLRTDGPRHRAVVVRMDLPNHGTELGSVDIADDGWNPSISGVDPDDTAFTIAYWTGPTQGPIDFHDASTLHADGSITPRPAGAFVGFVSADLARAWPALGDFGPPPTAAVASPSPR